MLRCVPKRLALSCALLASCLVAGVASAEDTLFQYDTDDSGYWHEGSNWDQGAAPNGASDVVSIDRPLANPTVTHSGASGLSVVKSLASEESIVVSGGTLEVLTTAQLNANFTLAGGTLKGGTITSVPGIDVSMSGNNGVDGITLFGDLQLTSSGDHLEVRNGLTLNGAANLWGSSATLNFAGTQTLGASAGQSTTVDMVPFNSVLRVLDGGTLTLDETVTVSGEGYIAGFGAGHAVVNEGLIHADHASGYMRITADSFTNTGTLRASSNGSLSLQGASWDNDGVWEDEEEEGEEVEGMED